MGKNGYINYVVMAIAAAAGFVLGPVLGVNMESFYVQGRVYCDTCRIQFETKVSEYMKGVKVQLQCRRRGSPGDPVTLTVQGETDNNGVYIVPVDGDHEDEICEVELMSSPRKDCEDVMNNGRERARVVLTQNMGMITTTRYANSLGYMKTEPLPNCPDVLAELGFLPMDDLTYKAATAY